MLVAEVVVNLGDEAGDLLADEADDRFSGDVGRVKAFPAAMGAEAV